ncbi:hypothetical protein [Pseudoxanthomonas mexicana]
MRKNATAIRSALFWLLLMSAINHFDLFGRALLAADQMQHSLHRITNPQ